MFQRYDIADNRDKLTALEAARRFASLHPGLSEPAVRHPELAQSKPSEWDHPHQPQKASHPTIRDAASAWASSASASPSRGLRSVAGAAPRAVAARSVEVRPERARAGWIPGALRGRSPRATGLPVLAAGAPPGPAQQGVDWLAQLTSGPALVACGRARSVAWRFARVPALPLARDLVESGGRWVRRRPAGARVVPAEAAQERLPAAG